MKNGNHSLVILVILLCLFGVGLFAQQPPAPIAPTNPLPSIPSLFPNDIIRLETQGVSPELLNRIDGQSTDPFGQGKGVGENNSLVNDPAKDATPSSELAEKLSEEEKRKNILLESRRTLPPARIFGQQFFRDNSLTLLKSDRRIEAQNNYQLDAMDEISLSIWGDSKYSGVFKVTEEGYVDFSKEMVNIPRLYVRGMTFGRAKELIKSHVGRYINLAGPATQIEILLNYSRTITINIAGEVFQPGSYTIPALNTAFNALVPSGGPSQNGSVRKIQIVSANKVTRILDVYRFIQDPSPKEEFFLGNNDFLYVPIAGRVVEIKGSVKRPFRYELIENEELFTLIGYSGGLDADAYTRNIQVKRFVNNEEVLIDLNLEDLRKSKNDFKLLDGDIVNISPITQQYSNYVNVVGAVQIPGQFELQTGKTRIADIIRKAGLLGSARTDRAYVIRVKEDLSKEYIRLNLTNILINEQSEENILLSPFDLLRIDPKSRFKNDYAIVVSGAVREPGAHIYSPNLTLKDVIFLCGGLKEEAANNRIEISRIVKGASESTRVVINTVKVDDALSIENDYLLEPFDQIFVRFAPEFEVQRNVTINGEVRFPGVYSLVDKNERISSLILRAGGVTEAAFLEGSTFFRKEDTTGNILLNAKLALKDNNSPFNYLLKDGDVVFIPKVKDIVTLKGAINYPAVDSGLIKKISVPYHYKKNAKFYVEEYGAGINRTKNGRNSLIFVTYPNGEVKKTKTFLFFKKYPIVEKGSVVTVNKFKQKEVARRPRPNRAPFNFQTFLSNTVSSITSLLFLYVLIERVRN